METNYNNKRFKGRYMGAQPNGHLLIMATFFNLTADVSISFLFVRIHSIIKSGTRFEASAFVKYTLARGFVGLGVQW